MTSAPGNDMAMNPAGQKACGGTYWHSTPTKSHSVEIDVRADNSFLSTAGKIKRRSKPTQKTGSEDKNVGSGCFGALFRKTGQKQKFDRRQGHLKYRPGGIVTKLYRCTAYLGIKP